MVHVLDCAQRRVQVNVKAVVIIAVLVVVIVVVRAAVVMLA